MTIAACGWKSYAIKSDGSLWSWGENREGSLGDGTTIDRLSPVWVMDDIIAVSSYGFHAMAIKSDGSLWGWGVNRAGAIGDGTKSIYYGIDTIIEDNNRHSPVRVFDDVIAVAAGGGHTVALRRDGSMWTWGGNYAGQLGTEQSLSTSAEMMADPNIITNITTPIKIIDDIIYISTRAAIKSDGSLWAWGSNHLGQIGDGTTIDRYTPIKIMDDVVAVSNGIFYTVAIKADGSLWAWGDNYYGQLGDGTKRGRKTPIKIMDDVLRVSAGHQHTMAIKKDGSLWGWGSNRSGQLGASKIQKQNAPTKIMDNIAYVSAGGEHTMAIKKDGSLWGWGWNKYGQLGNGTTKGSRSPICIMDDVCFPYNNHALNL